MSLLSWLAPPVVGAAIGFVTNDIAIRMLFRPLRAYRVLGVRVPFTPGIIPRRRHELAQAIGRMVSEELVTAQTLGDYLSRDGARETFRGWMSRATSQVLDVPVANLGGTDGGQDGLGTGIATELLEGFLRSDRFEDVLRSALRTILVSLEGASLSSLAGEGDTAAAIGRAVVRMLPVGTGGAGGPDAAAVEATVRAARVLAAPAGRGLSRWLSTSQLRPQIERGARDLLRSALEKLSPFQRIVVRAGKYDRRLEEKLPEIVDETLGRLDQLLSDPGTLEALGDAVRAALDPRDTAAETGSAGPATQAVTDGPPRVILDTLADLVAAWVRPLISRPLGLSVGELAGLDPQELLDGLATRIADRAREPGTAARILEALRSAARSGGGMGDGGTVGDLLGVSTAAKTRVDTLLADKALELLRLKLPDLLAGLDLRSLVVGRIDGLDVRDVEKLLMMVIARHLKWINVFGAILGFLIGLVQSVLNNFTV